VRESRFDPGAFLCIQDVLLEGQPKLLACGVRLLVLDDPAAHPDHLREGPVRHAFSVRETPAAMPERLGEEAVDVFLELPREA
jgi:hypothetical protein